MTAITAITAQNTVGVERGRGGLAGDDRRPGAGGRRGHRRRRGEDRDARARRRRSRRWSRRSACVGEAPVVVDPVMVAESGAVLLDEEARRGAGRASCCRWPTVVTPNIPEARALTGRGEEATQEELARGGARARARGRWSSPAATASESSTSSSTASEVGRDPRRAPSRTAPRTAPAAPTPRRWRPSSPAATTPLRPRAAPARSPPRRSAHGLREIGAGPGPGRRLRPRAARATPSRAQ